MSNNTATLGGAIYFSDFSKGQIENSNFYGNRADYGSAIYFTSGVTCDQVNLTNLHILENYANFAGAIAFANATPSCFDFCISCDFSNNQALYGPDTATGIIPRRTPI